LNDSITAKIINYKNYFRLDLTKEPVEKTIETLKLYPQETLTLEER
jgi:hypothetical protein